MADRQSYGGLVETIFVLNIRLLSDTTFANHNPGAGIVDTDVVHDEFGMPFIVGKTLQGLLRDSWLSMAEYFPELSRAAVDLFGEAGDVDQDGLIHVGDATLPVNVRRVIREATERARFRLHWRRALDLFTDIRYQTSVDRRTGAPASGSLRAERVVLRGTTFHAPLTWLRPYAVEHRQCLALAVLGVRHAGLGRNRGRGHVELWLNDGWETTRSWARGDDGDV